MNALSYLFWPNLGTGSYGSPTMIILLAVSAGFVVASFIVRWWRAKKASPTARRLSGSWPSAALWFGLVGVILVVSRVEGIQFLSMRFLWILWAAALALYGYFQMRRFRLQHYEVLPRMQEDDPRAKYLPRKK